MKNSTYAEAVSGTKNICGKPVKDIQKIGKRTYGKKDHKVVGNESINQESIYARFAKASSFSDNPPSHLIFALIHLLCKTLEEALTYLKG